MSPQERCLLVEGWKYSVSTLYVGRTITKTARFKRWLMSFCTVVVFVDKLLVSDTRLIYEHTTFASQNDVQNHHKNILPRFGLEIKGTPRAPPLDLPLNSLRFYYWIIFPISNIHSLWWLQNFLLSSHVLLALSKTIHEHSHVYILLHYVNGQFHHQSHSISALSQECIKSHLVV